MIDIIIFVGLVKILQVLNFNTICLQNDVLYECIEDQDLFLTWDVRQSSSSTSSMLFTRSYSRLGSTANYTETTGSSTFSVQLIFMNSTFISSVLTITNVTSLRESSIMCNGEMENLADSILYSENSGGFIY